MSAQKFRKKPVVIEAMQFDGTSFTAHSIVEWAEGAVVVRFIGVPERQVLVIETLEGRMSADAGDWIIRGVKGEFYPCKSDIFEATYEKVADNASVPEVRGDEAP